LTLLRMAANEGRRRARGTTDKQQEKEENGKRCGRRSMERLCMFTIMMLGDTAAQPLPTEPSWVGRSNQSRILAPPQSKFTGEHSPGPRLIGAEPEASPANSRREKQQRGLRTTSHWPSTRSELSMVIILNVRRETPYSGYIVTAVMYGVILPVDVSYEGHVELFNGWLHPFTCSQIVCYFFI
jgi:hypothetical protein